MSVLNTKKQFDDVVEFMDAFAQVHYTSPVEPSITLANLRLSLINEELFGENELFFSMYRENFSMILDGICDVLYVTYGALASFGLKPVQITVKSTISTENRKVTISKYYTWKNGSHTTLEDIETSLIDWNTTGSLLGNHAGMERIENNLNSIVSMMLRIAEVFGFDLAGAFSEVHASNMSKLCSTKEDAEKSIKHRYEVEKNEDYFGAYVDEVPGGKFAIKRASDGKVLKGLSFFEPVFDKFM